MTSFKIPLRYRLLNAALARAMKRNDSFLRFDPSAMQQKAIQETGLSDFGHLHYQEGLQALADSLENDSYLLPIGRSIANYIIANFLEHRLRFTESLKTQPEIYEAQLRPPLIVTGLARSGTSFLHRMLSVDPTHRALPQWQLMRPFPEGKGKDKRRKTMARSLRFREPLVEGSDAIHYFRVDTPEECILPLGLTFNSLIFPTLLPAPGYLEWYLQNQDVKQKFIEYRQLLQFFQSEEPSRRLLMKTPAHTGNIGQIREAIPQAMFIQTHREPITCVSSLCSLSYTFYQGQSSYVDKNEIGRLDAELNEFWLRRNFAFREANPGVIYDIDYRELVKDPLGTVRGIYTHYNLPWTQEYETALHDFIHNNPKNKHGKHQYSPAEFGLDEGELKKRFRFYTEKMGL